MKHTRQMSSKKRKGFTLMEIIIVVIIIGILAMLVAPRFMDASSSAKDNAALAEHRTILGIASVKMAESKGNEVPKAEDIKKELQGGLRYTTVTGGGGTTDLVITTTFTKENPEVPSDTSKKKVTTINLTGTTTVPDPATVTTP